MPYVSRAKKAQAQVTSPMKQTTNEVSAPLISNVLDTSSHGDRLCAKYGMPMSKQTEITGRT